jgi:hypothetical protein
MPVCTGSAPWSGLSSSPKTRNIRHDNRPARIFAVQFNTCNDKRLTPVVLSFSASVGETMGKNMKYVTIAHVLALNIGCWRAPTTINNNSSLERRSFSNAIHHLGGVTDFRACKDAIVASGGADVESGASRPTGLFLYIWAYMNWPG